MAAAHEGRCGTAIPTYVRTSAGRRASIDMKTRVQRRHRAGGACGRIGTRSANRSRRILAFLLVAAAALTCLPATATAGSLPGKRFGPGVDPAPGYQGQTKCDPHVKPGVAAFRRLVMNAFPGTGKGYFTRSCSVGGQSEHKDGRAWDWMVSASSASDRKKVNKLFDWLLQRDGRGNRYARARRIGMMYMIWNRRIWFPWEGWSAYSGSSPHTDHVHFSFSWPGARKKTTFWNRHRSFVASSASHPSSQGLWALTGNSQVLTAGSSSFHGDRSNSVESGSAVGIAPTPSGEGYWMVKQSGKVLRFGDARRRGSFKGPGLVVDVESRPSGHGYWTVTRSGRVAAFGNAEDFGDVRPDVRIAGIAATPNGEGYWVVSRRGRVFDFGNARSLGDLQGTQSLTVDIEAAPEQGYWLVSRMGRVSAFGSAAFLGDVRNKDLSWQISSINSTPSGGGYWLVDEGGRVRDFGSAAAARATHSSTTTTTRGPANVPADPAPDEDLLLRSFLRERRARTE